MRYKIDKGDTLSKIAEVTGVSVEEIMEANPNIKNKDVIYADDTIEIPSKGVSGKLKDWWGRYVDTVGKLIGTK